MTYEDHFLVGNLILLVLLPIKSQNLDDLACSRNETYSKPYLKPRPNDRNMLRAFGHRVAMCCDMLGVVGSSLKMIKFEPTTRNTSQQGGQTHATCCAQQCCDMLRWHVAIVWPGLNIAGSVFQTWNLHFIFSFFSLLGKCHFEHY